MYVCMYVCMRASTCCCCCKKRWCWCWWHGSGEHLHHTRGAQQCLVGGDGQRRVRNAGGQLKHPPHRTIVGNSTAGQSRADTTVTIDSKLMFHIHSFIHTYITSYACIYKYVHTYTLYVRKYKHRVRPLYTI